MTNKSPNQNFVAKRLKENEPPKNTNVNFDKDGSAIFTMGKGSKSTKRANLGTVKQVDFHLHTPDD